MNKTTSLSITFGKTISRDKVIMVLIILLPVILVFAGAASSPATSLRVNIDNHIMMLQAEEISVLLYTITATVLVASVVSFFLGFNLKQLIPRLQQTNYKKSEIILAFITVMVIINIVMSIAIALFSTIWVDVTNYVGYIIGIFLASIIFSTIGLIVAEIVDTTTLGLYSILSLAVLDTAFLENPMYSRRYSENWISFMPSHESIQMVLRSVYDTSHLWTDNLVFIALYEVVLIVVYLIISKFR